MVGDMLPRDCEQDYGIISNILREKHAIYMFFIFFGQAE